MLAGFLGDMDGWMGFTEPGCAGWFFLNEGVLDGFLLNRVCGLVFTEQWCSGWFVQNSVLADFYGTSVCLLKVCGLVFT